MCGIVGLTDRNDFYLLQKMAKMLSHRGPDEQGEFIDNEHGVALAMRRLSIIDLETGKQPIPNEDGTIWVICNGEIFNSPELREYLLAKGHLFRTKNSDVEVLVHLYEEEGTNLVHQLSGMYAFVIYDKRNNIIWGARDRMGIKPFYYSQHNGRFAFSSELKSLLVLPWVSREIQMDSLYHYISLQFVPPPNSIFKDIRKLQAGNSFVYRLINRELTIKNYWNLAVDRIEQKPVEEWEEIIREKLKGAVKRWTLSDVPIACSLSGGVDSSAVVGLLAESGGKDIRTYSLGFESPEEQDCDELLLARMVAERFGTKHHEVRIKPEEVLNDLERMVWHLDEPYGGGLPSWYIYKVISRDAKVCLTGIGGDELFGNYGKYEVYEKPRWRRYLNTIKPTLQIRSLREVGDSYKYPRGHFYPRYFSDAFKDNIVFGDRCAIATKTEALLEDLWTSADSSNPRNAVAYVDFHLQLPEEFLLVTDRFSMAHSVEARTPFLDHTLVEAVFHMPPAIRTGGREPKGFLKNMLQELLPQELLDVPKQGFILPLCRWTRRELRPLIEDLLSRGYLRQQGIFSDKIYEEIVKPHLSGKRDYTQQVWTLLMFQMWAKQML